MDRERLGGSRDVDVHEEVVEAERVVARGAVALEAVADVLQAQNIRQGRLELRGLRESWLGVRTRGGGTCAAMNLPH
jgi:hypothetical protein